MKALRPSSRLQTEDRPTVTIDALFGNRPDDNAPADYGQLLMAMYWAFNAKDIDTVLEVLTPDVDWPNAIDGGRLTGRDAVKAYWQRQWQTIDPQVEPWMAYRDEQGRTVVDVHQVVRDLSGNLLKDQRVLHIYEFEDGRVRRMDIAEAPSE